MKGTKSSAEKHWRERKNRQGENQWRERENADKDKIRIHHYNEMDRWTDEIMKV